MATQVPDHKRVLREARRLSGSAPRLELGAPDASARGAASRGVEEAHVGVRGIVHHFRLMRGPARHTDHVRGNLQFHDIDLMLDMSYLFRDRADFHTKLAEAATLRRLRGWVTGNEERLAIEALDELRRRNRPEPRKRLMRLLRSSHNDVRIAALAQLVDSATREDLSALLREYLSAENYHYYNVLCELDRLMAEVPPLYRQ